MSVLRVAAAGVVERPHDAAAALALAERRMGAAVAAGARLLVLPQRLLSSDGSEGRGILSDAPPLRALAEAARRHAIAVVCGYLEDCSGRSHDAALFIDRNGCALANYRRTHPDPADGADELALGQWLNLVSFAGLRFGLLVGADIDAPEPARALALAGAAALLVPARRAADGGGTTEALLRARAYENACGVVFANHRGADEGPTGLIVGPDGAVLAAGMGEIAVADLPVQRPEGGRRRLAARRPPLYYRLTAPHATDEPPRA